MAQLMVLIDLTDVPYEEVAPVVATKAADRNAWEHKSGLKIIGRAFLVPEERLRKWASHPNHVAFEIIGVRP